MTFNLINFWYGLRWSKGKFVKKSQEHTAKDNVTITLSNISQNDGTIKVSKILKSLHIFLTMNMTFNLKRFLAWSKIVPR